MMKNRTKKFIVGGTLFMIFIMVASVMTVGLGNNDGKDKEQQEAESLQDSLCEAADHTIVRNGEVYEPCEEDMYKDCWDCINNRIYVNSMG